MRQLSNRIPIRGRGYSLATMACGPLACNTFAFICGTTGDAAIVDPSTYESGEFIALQEHLEGAQVKHILLTHGHADHVAGVADAVRAWPHAQLHLHPLEIENYKAAPEMGMHFGLAISDDLPEPTDALKDRQILKVGDSVELEVLHTPGHSPGHVAFVDRRKIPNEDATSDSADSNTNDVGSVIIGGDLLFRGSVGRTDFPNSSPDDLFASLRRLYEEYADESIVLSGHTTATNLKTERETNPFVASALQRPHDWFDEAKERNGWS